MHDFSCVCVCLLCNVIRAFSIQEWNVPCFLVITALLKFASKLIFDPLHVVNS